MSKYYFYENLNNEFLRKITEFSIYMFDAQIFICIIDSDAVGRDLWILCSFINFLETILQLTGSKLSSTSLLHQPKVYSFNFLLRTYYVIVKRSLIFVSSIMFRVRMWFLQKSLWQIFGKIKKNLINVFLSDSELLRFIKYFQILSHNLSQFSVNILHEI